MPQSRSRLPVGDYRCSKCVLEPCPSSPAKRALRIQIVIRGRRQSGQSISESQNDGNDSEVEDLPLPKPAIDVSEFTFDVKMKSTHDNDTLYKSYLTYKLGEFNFRDIFAKSTVKAEQEATKQGATMSLDSSEAVIHHFHKK
jgi:hypothetical protein